MSCDWEHLAQDCRDGRIVKEAVVQKRKDAVVQVIVDCGNKAVSVEPAEEEEEVQQIATHCSSRRSLTG
jgi:hypothetical protein